MLKRGLGKRPFFAMASKWLCSFFLLNVVALKCLSQSPSSCINNDPETNSTLCGSGAVCNSDLQCECQQGFFTPSGRATDCKSTSVPDPACSTYSTDCIYCGSTYEGPCMKCIDFVTPSGECVNSCGTIFQINILSNTTLSAKVCEDAPSSSDSSKLPQWAIIVIAVMAGFVILTGLVIMLVLLFTWFNQSSTGQFDVEDSNNSLVVPSPSEHRTTKNLQSYSVEHTNEDRDFSSQHNPAYYDDDGDTELFMKKLAYLRTEAQVFLSMLNDMRRRLKDLPPDALTAQQYRNVMRDVTRLLYLLNKKPSAIEIPPDGVQLLVWSEQILQRYLASQGNTPRGHSSVSPNRLSAIGNQAETNF